MGNLPTKIIYYRGIDSELDFDGITVLMHTKGSGIFEHGLECTEGGRINITSNIDFNAEGVYEVIINWGTPDITFQEIYRYHVQVIEP
jgi:hypothetical protein